MVEEGISREVTGMVSRGITRRQGNCEIGTVDCARKKKIKEQISRLEVGSPNVLKNVCEYSVNVHSARTLRSLV
jgi:hypothetical protein